MKSSGKKCASEKIVRRNVELDFPNPTSVFQKTVRKTFNEDDMKKKDEELATLRQLLNAAQAQLVQRDDVILGEIRSLSQRVAIIEEAITKVSNDSGSSATRNNSEGYVSPKVTIIGDEVQLGEGIVCTLSAWNTMCSTSDDTMWCNAFVMGILKEDAHLYGLLPRKGKMKFPDNFKRIAILHWTDYLVRKGCKLPLPKKLSRSVLAKLSSRCHDAGGRRNTGLGRRPVDTFESEQGDTYFLNPETGDMEDKDGRPYVFREEEPNEIARNQDNPLDHQQREEQVPVAAEEVIEHEETMGEEDEDNASDDADDDEETRNDAQYDASDDADPDL